MAMSIGGRSGGDSSAADFVQLGERLAVPERAVLRVLADMNERADTGSRTSTRCPSTQAT
jgi:hypothetical protein